MSETPNVIKWKWVPETAQGEVDEEHSRVSGEAEHLTEKGQSVRFNGPGTLYWGRNEEDLTSNSIVAPTRKSVSLTYTATGTDWFWGLPEQLDEMDETTAPIPIACPALPKVCQAAEP